ncbi:MAG: YbhB/YbcL family Raf kinase inhibitor-like protein [Nanobdellota archaeon]
MRVYTWAVAIALLIILSGCSSPVDTSSGDVLNESYDATSHGGESMASLTISSPAFGEQEHIPKKYSCKGDDINPELTFQDIPDGTESLVLIMDDPDAPGGTFDHWVLFDIPAATSSIKEDSVPDNATEGSNSFGNVGYGGPCPPSGTHRYQFKLYAVDTTIELPEGATKDDVLEAIDGHVLEDDMLTGLFSK